MSKEINEELQRIKYLMNHDRSQKNQINEIDLIQGAWNKGVDAVKSGYNYASQGVGDAWDKGVKYGKKTYNYVSKKASNIYDYIKDIGTTAPTVLRELSYFAASLGFDAIKALFTSGLGIREPIRGFFMASPGMQKFLMYTEEVWLKICKNLGIITVIVKTPEEVINTLNTLQKNSKNKLDQLVLGSHGNGVTYFIPTGGEGVRGLDDRFVGPIKNLIHSNSLVYFTACYGADSLTLLKETADKLNHPVSACKGVNVFGLFSTQGNYECKPGGKFKKNANGRIIATEDQLIKTGFCKALPGTPVKWIS